MYDHIVSVHHECVCDNSSEQTTFWYNLDAREEACKLPKRNEAEFSRELEETEAANAELITGSFVARDKYGEPLVAYFPDALHPSLQEDTFGALSNFIDAIKPKPKSPKPKATAQSESEQSPESEQSATESAESTAYEEFPSIEDLNDLAETEQDEPTLPKFYDQRHPPNSAMADRFGHRFRLIHDGAWHATGHAHEPPMVSKDFISTAGRLSHSYTLFQRLAELTYRLCTLFGALDLDAWSSARRFIAGLNHFHPETNICKTGKWECWAHRALLFNQETRTHRDTRDAMFGYAVIVTFGSFTGGEFVLPQLGLKFPHQPGDVIFVKGQLLQHFVTEWKPRGEGGERFCITHFSHQNLIDSVEEQLEAMGLLDERFSGRTPCTKRKAAGVDPSDRGTRKSTRNRGGARELCSS
jgi:hypothetical protein